MTSKTLNPEAGDWTALMANFGEMATVGAAVKVGADIKLKKFHEIPKLLCL